uniref:Uncharacterized protein n=1 Tax=Globodera pallida TaxID=36090 RepID=A0A183CSI1_GLOPA
MKTTAIWVDSALVVQRATQMGENGGGSGGGGQRKADDWGELKARLARLNDPNQFEEPNGSQPAVKGQQQNIGTAKAMPSNTARLPVVTKRHNSFDRWSLLGTLDLQMGNGLVF